MVVTVGFLRPETTANDFLGVFNDFLGVSIAFSGGFKDNLGVPIFKDDLGVPIIVDELVVNESVIFLTPNNFVNLETGFFSFSTSS